MRALLVFALFWVSLATTAAAQVLTGEGETPGQSVQIRDLRRDAAGNVMLRFVFVNDSPTGVSAVMLRAKGETFVKKLAAQEGPEEEKDGEVSEAVKPQPTAEKASDADSPD